MKAPARISCVDFIHSGGRRTFSMRELKLTTPSDPVGRAIEICRSAHCLGDDDEDAILLFDCPTVWGKRVKEVVAWVTTIWYHTTTMYCFELFALEKVTHTKKWRATLSFASRRFWPRDADQ